MTDEHELIDFSILVKWILGLIALKGKIIRIDFLNKIIRVAKKKNPFKQTKNKSKTKKN